MATLASNALTLVDAAKRVDPSGKTAVIVELLSQNNAIVEDILMKEGNLPTGHRSSVRTGLPSVYWKLLNQGVQPSKSTTAQIDIACGQMEAWSETDMDLARLGGNVNSMRLSESMAFIEAMGQEFASTLFYGNSSLNPEEFNGLAIQYSSLSAANGQNIISGGGSGSDNSSIWLIVWGDQTVHGVYPKGSKAGLEHEDLGLQTVQTSTDVAGTRLRAYQDRYSWKVGLCVKDWRFCVRIANCDISNLVANSSAVEIREAMIKAVHRLPSVNKGKACFYMNRSMFQFLDLERFRDVAASGMTYADVDGKLVPHFRNIPVKICDALTETEATVS